MECGKIGDIRNLHNRFCDIHAHYYEYEWTWAYEAVRGGTFEENPFVTEVIDHIHRKTALGDAMLKKLK